MKLQSLYEAQFQRDDEIHNFKVEQINTRYKNALQAVLVFTVITLMIAVYRYYIVQDYVSEGHFYQKLKQFQTFNNTIQISKLDKFNEGSLAQSNQQLGRMTWTILHLSVSIFPEQIRYGLKEKFNMFLVLFGQLYPCKPCGKLFLEYLAQIKPFDGETKDQIIIYLCDLHNKFNQDFGKQLYDCSTIKQEWKIPIL